MWPPQLAEGSVLITPPLKVYQEFPSRKEVFILPSKYMWYHQPHLSDASPHCALDSLAPSLLRTHWSCAIPKGQLLLTHFINKANLHLPENQLKILIANFYLRPCSEGSSLAYYESTISFFLSLFFFLTFISHALVICLHVYLCEMLEPLELEL